jgi:hypothetical protein
MTLYYAGVNKIAVGLKLNASHEESFTDFRHNLPMETLHRNSCVHVPVFGAHPIE